MSSSFPSDEVKSMESELVSVAEYAIEQPGVTGYLCIDKDGLCIAAKGQAGESMSGIIHQVADLAAKIEEPNRKSQANGARITPVIRVDLEQNKIIIQSRDTITTALISPQG